MPLCFPITFKEQLQLQHLVTFLILFKMMITQGVSCQICIFILFHVINKTFIFHFFVHLKSTAHKYHNFVKLIPRITDFLFGFSR